MASQTELSILVRVKDEAAAAFGRISGSLNKMRPAFAGMAAAGTVALGSIAAIGGKAVADFAEAEASSAMLKHAVIDVSHATEQQLQATNDLADALERKGVLDGDNIRTGLAQLSTFGLSNDAVRGLGGSLADLAVNQFGVSASGQQLSDSANMIAKALNGQFGILEKSGIRFSDAQIAAIKFGTEMEKVDAINQGFAQNLKFTNEVALSTTEGKMAKAAVSTGNLSEAMGSVLAPIVADFTKAVVPLLEKMQRWIEANPELTKNIVMVTAAIAAVLVVIGTLGLVIPTIITGVTALGAAFMFLAANPIGIIIVAIAAVVAGLIWLGNNSDKVNAAITAGWEAMGNALASIGNRIKSAIGSAFDWIISKADAVIAIVNRAIDMANRIPGVDIGSIGAIPGRASGGPVSSGRPYIVGEQGPELFVPGQYGTIMPNGSNGGMGVGGIVINIGTFVGGNAEAAARELGDLIIKRLQLNARVG